MNDIKWIPARNLIVPNRLDLMAKIYYVECKEKGYDISFAKEMYKAHIEAFSDGTYTEPGNADKNSSAVFMDTFDELIKSIKENGMLAEKSVIPVSPRGTIANGAHRVAIASFFGLDVPCEEEHYESKYNYKFFEERLLSAKYLDFMATRYIETSGKEVNLLIMWPAAIQKKEKYQKAIEYIESSCGDSIVYSKKIDVSYNGLRNLMIQVYADGFDWAGTISDHFKGIQTKADECYAESKRMMVYAIEKNSEDVMKIKETVREIIGISKSACHSTDSYEDAIELAHLFFNENSMHLMNNGIIDFDESLFERIVEFKKLIVENNFDRSKYVIDSSSVMGLYGIRKTNDLDYIALRDAYAIPGYDDNSVYLNYYGLNRDEMVLNPENYLYSYGMKFITLNVLKEYKKNRNREKDRLDVRLIEDKLKNSKSITTIISVASSSWKRSFRNFKVKVRNWLQKRNIYVFTKIWHFIKGKGFR